MLTCWVYPDETSLWDTTSDFPDPLCCGSRARQNKTILGGPGDRKGCHRHVLEDLEMQFKQRAKVAWRWGADARHPKSAAVHTDICNRHWKSARCRVSQFFGKHRKTLTRTLISDYFRLEPEARRLKLETIVKTPCFQGSKLISLWTAADWSLSTVCPSS